MQRRRGEEELLDEAASPRSNNFFQLALSGRERVGLLVQAHVLGLETTCVDSVCGPLLYASSTVAFAPLHRPFSAGARAHRYLSRCDEGPGRRQWKHLKDDPWRRLRVLTM